MTSTEKLMLAFLAAPTTVALILVSRYTPNIGWTPLQFIFTFMLSWFFAALASTVFAAPLYVLAKRYRLLNLATALAGGAITGAIVFEILDGARHVNLRGFIEYVGLGVAGAISFWIVYRWFGLTEPAVDRLRK